MIVRLNIINYTILLYFITYFTIFDTMTNNLMYPYEMFRGTNIN